MRKFCGVCPVSDFTGLQAATLQAKKVTGEVTSATDGSLLIGVSVQVQGSSMGTITDLDGKYSLDVNAGETLVFSYIGFKTQSVKVGTSSTINVVLEEDNEVLDEVVVVGYGVQKKKLVTGATVQVKGENIAKLNTTNPLQAMQGQTPGVNIASISGQPGSELKVSIRGLGTVGNAEPLYLIDGVRGDISNLNPADIESIDILKDAASAAIYGAQAANGVVLVTTKSGKEGKAEVSFDAYYGVQNVVKKAELLNTEQYMMIMDEQRLNSGNSTPYDWSSYKSIYDANGNLYDTDWLGAMFKDNAKLQSYTLGVSGGSSTSKYSISMGYMSQEGIIGGEDVSNYSRYNFRVNSEHNLFKDLLKVGEQVSFVYRRNTGIGVGGQYNNTLRGAYSAAPFVPIYSDNNIYDSPYNDTSNSDWNPEDGNPYGSMMTATNNENKNAFFAGNVYAELQPIKNLKIRTVFGANYYTNEYRSFSPLYQFGSQSRNTRTSVTQNMPSRFARGHRYGFFPSISAGWILTNEKFMKNTSSWLDYLKLRVSWGQVGNQNIDNYQYLAPIKMTNVHYFYGISGNSTAVEASALGTNWGAYPSRLSNEALTWETSEQTNIGFDARFFASRLGVNFDFYIKSTKDWLLQAPILNTTGTGAPYINGGDVKNTGVELALTWNDNIGKDFSYNISLNGAFNKNKVGKIPTEDGIIHGSSNELYNNAAEFYRAENGEPIGYFWGYQTAGIFQNEREIEEWRAAGNGILQADPQPGDVRYVDVDHNGVINDDDKVNLGNGIPDFTLGFNIGFEYKGFDLSLVANGAFGHQIVQSYRNHTRPQPNYTVEILERWHGEGTSNRIPRVTDSNINWEFSDLYIHNGNYLRLSTMTLGYDFSKLFRFKAFKQARLYFQVQNLLTITKYNGMDPEVGYGADSNAWVSGVDLGYYPRPRTVLVGVNLKF